MKQELKTKIAENQSVGGVVGLGYVGLPLVLHLCDVGYRVIGYDVDEKKVDALNRGESYIKHIPSGSITEKIEAGMFEATTDFSRLSEADCISICVPTPLDKNFEPDLRYVRETAEVIGQNLRAGQLVLLESTTYPGTTTELVLPLLKDKGLEVGKDFFLAYSPEREDPGNPDFTISNIPKVIGGVTPACTEVATDYYGKIFEKIEPVSTPAAAELTKLLENIFRCVNIALVNELKMLCDRMKIDVWEVISAASTKPFGYMPFYPGPGLGGHCIPIDPFYLSWKAREYEFPTRFIELAGEINTSMPYYVVTRIMEALNEQEITLKGARVLVLGMAYKKDVDDTRESPSLKIIELLQKRGASIDYNDPYIPTLPQTRKYDMHMDSVDLTPENLGKYDCAVVITDHSVYDYNMIVEHSRLVVDTRNATSSVTSNRDRIFKA
ncbi:nucleotide sugar dehydrogenase [Candidatus Hydrogenedentota bacterium]